MKKKNRFKLKDERTLTQKLKSFWQSMLFWRGRKKVMIHTRNITWSDIRAVFFPKSFAEKYRYLGTSVWQADGMYYEALYPLVISLDYNAKPRWCPRWFLRFLHLFGNDNSIVRIRNRKLSNLHRRLTKGIMFMDWKTKWEWYDLRISISAPHHLQQLADAIEEKFYDEGVQKELIEQIKKLDPTANPIRGSVSRLKEELEKLEEANSSVNT